MDFLDKLKKKIEHKVAPLKEFFDKDPNYRYGETIDHHIDSVEEFKDNIKSMEELRQHKYIDPFLKDEVKEFLKTMKTNQEQVLVIDSRNYTINQLIDEVEESSVVGQYIVELYQE